MKQRNPSVLHDTVEALEGECGTGVAKRDPCDDASKSRACQGEGGALPSIATSSNNGSSCRDACGDMGDRGWGVRNVVCAVPILYGVVDAPHVAGVRPALLVPLGSTANHRGVTAGVLGCVAGGASTPNPVRGADSGVRGCVRSASSHPHSDSSSCNGGFFFRRVGAYGYTAKQEWRLVSPHVRQVVCPFIPFNTIV